jgi:hypothetical protein
MSPVGQGLVTSRTEPRRSGRRCWERFVQEVDEASMAEPDIRKGMPSVKLTREEFEKRYRRRFADPVFAPLQRELDAIIAAAWDAYSHSRKSPVTRKGDAGFADPDYEISVDWLAARDAVMEAQRASCRGPTQTRRVPRRKCPALMAPASVTRSTIPAENSRAARRSRSQDRDPQGRSALPARRSGSF